MAKGKLVKFGDVPGIDPPVEKKTKGALKAKKVAPGPKVQVKTTIKEALNKALEHRADQLGVQSVIGFGMKDGPATDKPPAVGTQGFLFGEGDKIRAALSSELVIINAEIGGAERRKMGINEIISCLSDRRRIVEDAMLALDKVKDKKKPAKKAAKKPRACRVCGCTEASACEGGCSWVSDDLCSACAEKRSKPDKKKQQSEPKPKQEKKAS